MIYVIILYRVAIRSYTFDLVGTSKVYKSDVVVGKK
jgi:hypothetical protein